MKRFFLTKGVNIWELSIYVKIFLIEIIMRC